MSELIDLTITLSECCGTCKHYKFLRSSYRRRTPIELVERFKGVPHNGRKVLGGYCLQNEKVRLTSRLAKCDAWERTTNKALLGMFRRSICTHEYVIGCSEKIIASHNLLTEADNNQRYRPIIKFPYLRLETWMYCKFCNKPQRCNEDNSKFKSRTYTIYLSKKVSEAYKAYPMVSHSIIERNLNDFVMTPEDKNPDYYELADIFTKLKVKCPLPEGFEIKTSWNQK